MLTLTNPVQAYAWGAVDGLTALVGVEPTGGPQAEMWIGGHPSAPSTVADGRTLDQVLSAEAGALLGPEVASRQGGRLPILLKVLSIGAPLSIQLHPDADQAAVGFAREDDLGIALDDPRRTYRDPHAKPEILVALEPTWALAGFRSGAASAALLRACDARLDDVAAAVEDQPDSRAALIALLEAEPADRDRLAAVAANAEGPAEEIRWVRRIAEAHPSDPTALAPLILQLRRLAPGEGIHLPAGVPHAYLHGAGVELMGASDNVVRGGLTPKHIDRQALVELLAPPGVGPRLLPAPSDDGWWPYRGEPDPLVLHRAEIGEGTSARLPDPIGAVLVIATEGQPAVRVGDDSITLTAGRAALVAADERARARIAGPGVVWCATVA